MKKLSVSLIFFLLTACQTGVHNQQVTASGVDALNKTTAKLIEDSANSISKTLEEQA